MKSHPRIKFSSKYSGRKDKRTIDQIKELISYGRLIEHRDLNPLDPVPKGHRKIFCYYFDNKIVKFHKNDSSISVVKFFDNTFNKLNKKKKRKKLTFKYHADKRRMSRVVSEEEIERAIYYGIWVPDFKLDSVGYPRYDSRYFINDLCVVVAEKKEELRVQTIYRISPASDHDFIGYLKRNNSCLKDMSFYVLNQTKINRFLNSNESNIYRTMYLHSEESAILDTYTEKLIEVVKDSSIYSSRDNKFKINTNWNPILLKPNIKYSIAFLFISDSEDKGNLSNKDKKYFRSLGLDINKNCVHGSLNSTNYTFAIFDMGDYSGSNHTWARKPSVKPKSAININEETNI